MSTRRARLLALVASLAAAVTGTAATGCYTGDIRDTDDFTVAPPIADEPNLGPLLLEASQLRPTFISSTFKNATGYVYVYEGEGWDEHVRFVDAEASFFHVDPDTGVGTPAVGPPLPPHRQHQFGVMLGGGALLFVGRPGTPNQVDVGFYLGDAWTTAPGPAGLGIPQIALAVARSASELVLVTQAGEPWVFDGTTWRILALPVGAGSEVVTGPWDAGGLRLAYTSGDRHQVCSVLYAGATLATGGSQPEAPLCAALDTEGLAGPAVNGTIDDFQVLTRVPDLAGRVRLVRFANGATTIGRAFPGTSLVASPGAARPLVAATHANATAGNYFPSLLVVESGELDRQLVEGGFARTACACDRSVDPQCPCFARELTFAQGSTDAAGARYGLVLIDDVDGRRRLHVRILALPFEGTPFPALPCTLECGDTLVCAVDPASGDSTCVPPGNGALAVEAHLAVTPIDPVLAATATVVLTSADPACSVTYVPALDHDLQLDPHCTYTLDATAPGHVPLHVEAIQTAGEDVPVFIGPYTLARGGLLAADAVSAAGFTDTTRLAVSPAGERMVLAITGTWRWVARAAGAPGFTVASLASAPSATFGDFPVATPRFVAAARALVHTATHGLALVDDGVVAASLAGPFDLARGAFARAAPAAVFPSGGYAPGPPGTAATTSLVQFAGATLSVVATAAIAGRGPAIRADGSAAAFFDGLGRLVRLDAATGTTSSVTGGWPYTGALRVALGPDDDFLVVAPRPENTSLYASPCHGLQPCRIYAREDVPQDPGDPPVRTLVELTDRARWAEIGSSVGHVAWLGFDAQGIVHLYHRDTTTQTTTELPLGAPATEDLAHVAIDDTLLVMVREGIVVVDLATGMARLEPGTFASGNSTLDEPLLRVGDDGRIYLAEACVLGTDPCGMWIYAPATDSLTRLARGEVARFGTALDRRVEALVVAVVDAIGSVLRTYQLTDGVAGVEPTFRTSRSRGAPCVVYWRDEPAQGGPSGNRRWHCSD